MRARAVRLRPKPRARHAHACPFTRHTRARARTPIQLLLLSGARTPPRQQVNQLMQPPSEERCRLLAERHGLAGPAAVGLLWADLCSSRVRRPRRPSPPSRARAAPARAGAPGLRLPDGVWSQ